MRIVMSGGIFGAPMESYALSAPENVLRRYFVEEGHEVIALGAGSKPPHSATGDVFHAHHFGAAAYYLTLAGARPLVFTSHNPFLVSPYPVPESRLEVALQRSVLHAADRVVALAKTEADQLSARFQVPRERFAVIPNGIDLDHYAAPERPRRDRLELLAVGQLQDYKGHTYLLRALARVLRAGHDAGLTIIAHRDDQHAVYAAECRELGIAERVSFEGPFSTAELAERYSACDIFVQPSLAECFPVTILEAMACGAPIVATDVGGVAEEVDDAGLVVPSRDAEALATAIVRLCDQPEERRSFGRRGRARVERLYDGRDVARRHLELYAELAPRAGHRTQLRSFGASALVDLYLHRARAARLIPGRIRRLGAPS